MGLSIAISGGITATVLVIILGIIFAISYQINSDSLANTESFEIQNSLLKTNLDIKSINAAPGVSTVDFLLFNNGSTKLWNYNDFDMLVTYDANIGGVSTRITESLTYNETASFGGLPSITFARPIGTVDGQWQQSTGCTSPTGHLCVDEVIQDDTDFIGTQNLAQDSFDDLNFTLNAISDPGIDTGHILRYTYGQGSTGADNEPELVVSLYQGDSLIATRTESKPLPGTYALATYTLDQFLEVPLITDYSNLKLGFNGTCDNVCNNPGPQRDRVFVSWAELEVPPNQNPILGLDTKEWGISNLNDDVLDPRLLNSQESASIRLELTYPIFSNGFLEITISSDNGKVNSDSIIAT